MIRATIGKAISAMQAPMNIVAFVCEMPAVNSPDTVNRKGVIAEAIAKGAMIPAS
jgi:hypothetical protein